MPAKISQLTELQNPPLTGLIPVVVGGATRKATIKDLLNAVTGGTVTSLSFTGGNLKANPNPITVTGNVYFYLPGMVLPFAGTVAPSGWVFCNGQELSRFDYPELYAAIGTRYGARTTATFSVPDIRGRIPFGVGKSSADANKLSSEAISPNHYTLGATGGFEKHTLSGNQVSIRSHSHSGSGRKRIYGSTNKVFYNGDCKTPGSYCDLSQCGVIVEGKNYSGYNHAIYKFYQTQDTLSSDSNPYNESLTTQYGYKDLQTITWTQALPNVTLPVDPIPLVATSSSGLTVNFRVHSGPAYMNGNNLVVYGVGWVSVEAYQSGNDNVEQKVYGRSFFVNHLPHNNMPPVQVVNYIIKT